jgi:hypothetical protein
MDTALDGSEPVILQVELEAAVEVDPMPAEEALARYVAWQRRLPVLSKPEASDWAAARGFLRELRDHDRLEELARKWHELSDHWRVLDLGAGACDCRDLAPRLAMMGARP